MCGIHQTLSQQSNIESQVTRAKVDGFFFAGKQIEEQRADAGFANRAGDELIAWTMTAAAGTMSEQHHALSAGRNVQLALKHRGARLNLNLTRSSDLFWGSLNHLIPSSQITPSMLLIGSFSLIQITSSVPTSLAASSLPFNAIRDIDVVFAGARAAR